MNIIIKTPLRYFGKSLILFLLVILFLPLMTSAHETGEAVPGGGEKGILFIAMGPSNNFVMIDLATEKVMKAVAGPVNPHGIAVTPDGKYAYLTSRNPGKKKKSMLPGDFPVSVVEIDSGKIKTTINVGGESHHVWMSPDGKEVYVTVPSVEGVVVIDTVINQVVKTIETGFKANSIVTSPDGKFIYVVNKGDDTLSVIDRGTFKVIKSITTGKGPDHLTITPDGKYIYITASYANEVWMSKTDPLMMVAKASVGKGPHGIAVSSDGKEVFVASRGNATFSVFSGPDLKKVYSMKLGKGPGHVKALPGNGYVYINDEVEFRTYVYDPTSRKVIHTIYLWPEPHETAFFIPGE
jgi:YVTN family beta-propeller protein